MKKTVFWKFLGLGLLWIPVLSSLALFVFTADRGLQMTDEASYLLIAADPWHMGGHGTFYGFVLYPFWELVGGHVAGFRVTGFLVLALAALGLCLVAVRRGPSGKPSPFLVQGAFPLFLAGAFAFYSDGVRTPHYNWVVLVGAMIWCGGLLEVSKAEMSGTKVRFGTVVGGIGCALMVLGKWPGAFAVFGVSLLAMYMARVRVVGWPFVGSGLGLAQIWNSGGAPLSNPGIAWFFIRNGAGFFARAWHGGGTELEQRKPHVGHLVGGGWCPCLAWNSQVFSARDCSFEHPAGFAFCFGLRNKYLNGRLCRPRGCVLVFAWMVPVGGGRGRRPNRIFWPVGDPNLYYFDSDHAPNEFTGGTMEDRLGLETNRASFRRAGAGSSENRSAV
ncbi:MAG: hypothetical protein EBZ78_06675 [Verrucomicrobia bacterium]|nr:hypothetical protein [Verrucomicrobiota bacterium]